jgi:hypothetical protein
MNNIPEILKNAMQFLASQCDGDGFSREDIDQGRWLARLGEWDSNNLKQALYLARKYKKQLDNAGIEIEHVPVSKYDRTWPDGINRSRKPSEVRKERIKEREEELKDSNFLAEHIKRKRGHRDVLAMLGGDVGVDIYEKFSELNATQQIDLELWWLDWFLNNNPKTIRL